MKYICFTKTDGTLEIITFPRSINHDCMAAYIESMRDRMTEDFKLESRSPVSAGFVDANNRCYGKSETLGLESNAQEDTALLMFQLNDKG